MTAEKTTAEKTTAEKIRDIYDKIVSKDVIDHNIRCQALEKLEIKKNSLQVESRTAKLWLQYMNYVEISKSFIRASRTGDWCLHLSSISKMLNLFAATGHLRKIMQNQEECICR